jgi:hypothetical protein
LYKVEIKPKKNHVKTIVSKITSMLTRAKYQKLDDKRKKEINFYEIQERSPYTLRSKNCTSLKEIKTEESYFIMETPRTPIF